MLFSLESTLVSELEIHDQLEEGLSTRTAAENASRSKDLEIEAYYNTSRTKLHRAIWPNSNIVLLLTRLIYTNNLKTRKKYQTKYLYTTSNGTSCAVSAASYLRRQGEKTDMIITTPKPTGEREKEALETEIECLKQQLKDEATGRFYGKDKKNSQSDLASSD